MKYSDIKNDIIAPKNQKIIDKKTIVDGKYFHVISAYEEGNGVKIITLNIGNSEDDNKENINFGGLKTRRDELMMIFKSQDNSFISHKKFYLDDREIPIKSASSGIFVQNHQDYFMLSYIVNLGLDLEYLNDILLSNVVVSTFEIAEMTLADLDLDNVKTLRITRYPSIETVLANIDFNITLDKKTYSFKDNNVEYNFKARLEVVDAWKDLVPKVEEEFRKAYETLDEMEKEIGKSITSDYEEICPKGMNLLFVAYESQVQLNFYTKEFLDTDIERKNNKSFFFFSSNEANERLCVLGAIDGFEIENTEVELFSWIKSTEQNDIVVKLQ